MKSCGLELSQAVRKAYAEGKEDETLEPLVLVDQSGNAVGRIHQGHSVIFYNIRGEREIELTESLTEPDFDRFSIKENFDLSFATMIEYKKDLNVRVAFPPENTVGETLGEMLAASGLRQVRITEAEKAVHLCCFFNGKKSNPVEGEARVIVPTRKDIALFDEAPAMSIDHISQAVLEKTADKHYDFVLINFPNVDVLGHIENEKAVMEAVESVDRHLGLVVEAALKNDMTVIVTADHGTVEKWRYPDGAVDTGHTDSPVPFILLSGNDEATLRVGGELADVAPTVLELFGISKPAVMTGCSLLQTFRPKRTGHKRRIMMVILDGWGIQEASDDNLISRAETPVMDKLMSTSPYTLLEASGEAVGLPKGTVGNSEVGHLHIGAGRRLYSDRVRIDRAIEDGSFFTNDAFLYAVRQAKERGVPLHLMGIVSFFSSHGSVNHLTALLEMARREGLQDVFIHAMLGRRGEQPESGANYIEFIEKKAAEMVLGKVVSVIGRYWSMDREENWDRIEKTYRMLVYGEGQRVQEGGNHGC